MSAHIWVEVLGEATPPRLKATLLSTLSGRSRLGAGQGRPGGWKEPSPELQNYVPQEFMNEQLSCRLGRGRPGLAAGDEWRRVRCKAPAASQLLQPEAQASSPLF